MKSKPDELLVYSSEKGRICHGCSHAVSECLCAKKKSTQLQGDGKVKVRRETKGRAGKTVTTVSGLPLNSMALELLLSELKRRCGSGGTVKDGVLEIQGDHCEVLISELTSRGYAAKKAGG